MGRSLEKPQDSELQMGEADRKKQREMSRKFRFVVRDCAVQVTILLRQASEGLVDSEKSFWGRTQAHTIGCLEELIGIGNLRCSAFHNHEVVLGDHALFDLEEMNHNRSHSDHEVVFGDQ